MARRRKQILGGLPRERLHVLLAAGGLDQADRGRAGQPPHGVDLPGGPLVHRRQAGLRARLPGQLRGQAGDGGVQQPVHAGRRHLGRVAERRGELVAVRGQVDAVEPGGAGELPVQVGGGVGDPGQGAAHGCLKRLARPDHMGQHRAGHAERHRCLQRPGRRVVADGRAEPAEDRGEQVVTAGAGRPVGIARRPDGGDGQRGRPFHERGQRGGLAEAEHAQAGRSGHALDQRDAFLRAERELAEPGLAQRLACRDQGFARPSDPADAGYGAERVGQLHDLARRSRAGAGHGGHQAAVQQIGEQLAQLARHRGVTGQERQQPDHDDRPHLRLVQPRRTARGPRQQQVALVRALLLLGQADRGQRSHAGVHAIDQPPVGQRRHGRGPAPPHRGQHPRRDADRMTGGHRTDQPEIRVAGDLQERPQAR